MQTASLPPIADLIDLEERLSRPDAHTVEALHAAPGDILLLGAGGKMGPTLARMARRATGEAGDSRRVVAVSRFNDPAARRALEDAGIETLAGNLLDPDYVATLPQCPNVIYMVGFKFGASRNPGAAWATNAFLPGLICRQFRHSRIVSFSTGNVYPLVPIDSGGAVESEPLQPVGEYGMSALARERIFAYFCTELGIPTVILRLNYAVEMRYGVLVDLARQIIDGTPISLAVGYFNCIWQGDANELTLRSLAHATAPARVFNLTGGETICARDACEALAAGMGTQLAFTDPPAPTALLSNARETLQVLGPAKITTEQLIAWTADWIQRGAPTWDRPTHFEVRDGRF